MTNVTPFPTEEYIDNLAVEKALLDLATLHQEGKISNLMVVRFEKNGETFISDTGGLTLAQMSFGIACLQRHLWECMGK